MMHPAYDDVMSIAAGRTKEADDKILDSAGKNGKPDNSQALDEVSDFDQSSIALNAAAVCQEWAETSADDLDDGEGLGDRLLSLIIGIADEDFDGEITDDSPEAEVANIAADAAADYLIAKGVPESDAVELLTDFDNDLAETVQELLIANLPQGDDDSSADMDSFVFGDDEAMDAVYKKRWVVRGGKKKRINKRVSGRVRLSAKQKMGIRKALRKANTASARMRRMKSMKVRKRAGL